jgi:hypothetical protein
MQPRAITLVWKAVIKPAKAGGLFFLEAFCTMACLAMLLYLFFAHPAGLQKKHSAFVWLT